MLYNLIMNLYIVYGSNSASNEINLFEMLWHFPKWQQCVSIEKVTNLINQQMNGSFHSNIKCLVSNVLQYLNIKYVLCIHSYRRFG